MRNLPGRSAPFGRERMVRDARRPPALDPRLWYLPTVVYLEVPRRLGSCGSQRRARLRACDIPFPWNGLAAGRSEGWWRIVRTCS